MLPQQWNWHEKAAFRELVTLGIMRYVQAKKVSNIKLFGKVISTYACKESIDRGGKTTACILWALGKDTQGERREVFYALHARALLARRRLILKNRLEPLLSLMKVMHHKEIQTFFKTMQNRAGVIPKSNS